MRNLIFATLAVFAATAALAQDPAPPPAAAPATPMTTAGMPQGVVMISADSFNAVMTVIKAMTDLAPELATPQVQKAFAGLRGCAQDNLAAPAAGQDPCPAVTAALIAMGAKPATPPVAAEKSSKKK